MIKTLQDAEMKLMDYQMMMNKHNRYTTNDLVDDPGYEYEPLPKKQKLVQNQINILCENTLQFWSSYHQYVHPFIRSISYELADIKIKIEHHMFDKLFDINGMAWSIFKYFDVQDMKHMIFALFDNITDMYELGSNKLVKIEDIYHSEFDLISLAGDLIEVAKKVDLICGLNKRGKLYLMLTEMSWILEDYQHALSHFPCINNQRLLIIH